jgi:hypothetical protein
MELLHIALATIAALLFIAVSLKVGNMKELDKNGELINRKSRR